MTVLKDMFGVEFTEGDRIAISTGQGLRVGKVLAIKDDYGSHSVSLDLSEHQEGTHATRMYVRRRSYGFVRSDFLKLPPLT